MMTQFLMFSLWAPLAAMGDVAVGERRYGAARPGKSAIMGMMAAALGIDRADEATHQALLSGYGLATRTEAPGMLLTDYHTVQTPAALTGRRKGDVWGTRKQQLSEPNLETLLSWREYRMDSHFLGALWERAATPYPMEALAEGLARPQYVLFLGRKACPLGAPPSPKILEAEELGEAFERYAGMMEEVFAMAFPDRKYLYKRSPNAVPVIYADVSAWKEGLLGQDQGGFHVSRRRDMVGSRSRWQFELREEIAAPQRGQLQEGGRE
ncbi:CRISPR system Cascade subunit CasD [Azospirillaceae bacterium]